MSYNNLAAVATIEVIKFLAGVWQEDNGTPWTDGSIDVLEVAFRRDQNTLFGVVKEGGLIVWSWDYTAAILEWMNETREGRKAGLAAIGDPKWAHKAVGIAMVNGRFQDGTFFYGGWWPLQEEVWDDRGFGRDDSWLFLGRNAEELAMAYKAVDELSLLRDGQTAYFYNGGLPWGACNNI